MLEMWRPCRLYLFVAIIEGLGVLENDAFAQIERMASLFYSLRLVGEPCVKHRLLHLPTKCKKIQDYLLRYEHERTAGYFIEGDAGVPCDSRARGSAASTCS
jgi:hypothetical protein